MDSYSTCSISVLYYMEVSGQHWHVLTTRLRSRDDDSQDMNRAILGQLVNCSTPFRSDPISGSESVLGCLFNSFYLPSY